jgi:putative endonuclease
LLKTWKRAWKIELIETANPEWRDLWDELALKEERFQLSLE